MNTPKPYLLIIFYAVILSSCDKGRGPLNGYKEAFIKISPSGKLNTKNLEAAYKYSVGLKTIMKQYPESPSGKEASQLLDILFQQAREKEKIIATQLESISNESNLQASAHYDIISKLRKKTETYIKLRIRFTPKINQCIVKLVQDNNQNHSNANKIEIYRVLKITSDFLLKETIYSAFDTDTSDPDLAFIRMNKNLEPQNISLYEARGKSIDCAEAKKIGENYKNLLINYRDKTKDIRNESYYINSILKNELP